MGVGTRAQAQIPPVSFLLQTTLDKRAFQKGFEYFVWVSNRVPVEKESWQDDLDPGEDDAPLQFQQEPHHQR
jgi:hypothetical protein